ncbi:MAG: GNAT family N-acetyltransferase [Candidatus Omnitrophica bacterium]|nr:GNAT family N-acetyltransferase [Candidatus Omnitrophota bacterium]
MTELLISRYVPTDRAALRRISLETAFAGYDREAFIQDDEILADALTSYFTDREPESCFVAVAGETVVGYIIGCPDVRRMNARFFPQVAAGLFGLSWRRGFWFKLQHWRFVFAVARSVWRREFRAPDFSKEYPAVLHINITRNFQGKGLGRRLMETYLEYLRSQKVTAAHCGTMSEEAKEFFLKCGFSLLHKGTRSYLEYRTNAVLPYYVLGYKFSREESWC